MIIILIIIIIIIIIMIVMISTYYYIKSAAAGGESDTLAVLNEDACARCIQENRDVIVGVKVRLTADVCGKGSTEHEAYR